MTLGELKKHIDSQIEEFDADMDLQVIFKMMNRALDEDVEGAVIFDDPAIGSRNGQVTFLFDELID